MKNRKSLRSVLYSLFLIAVCAVGIFSFVGCDEKCTEHDFETWPLTANCEEAGLLARNCKVCGYYEEIEGPALGHSFSEWSVVTTATCRSAGERRRSCNRHECDEVETEEIPMLKHTVDSWVATTQPSETKEGSARGNCTVHGCGATVTITLPVINEENYEIEVIDSESKNITLKNGEYAPELFVSNYHFININNESYSISVRSTISSERLVIPATYNGYPVVKIHSFANQTNIKEVVIPENVRTIEKGAFDGCTNLTSITLPSTVKTIGSYSSKGSSITSGEVDFYYNGTAESWCNITFYGKLKVDNLYFINGSGQYDLLTEITVPETVTAIGEYQFAGIKCLETVNMHSDITSIGNEAFNASGIKAFIMPDSVTAVGERAFASCKNLEEIKLSENLEIINSFSFAYCSSLQRVVIPANVKTVGGYSFDGCTALSEVNFAAGTAVSKLGNEAFNNCTSLTYIVLPDTVNNFGRSAINYPCSNIYYMGNANAFASIEGINTLSFWDNTVYYFSGGVPKDTDYQYWHFDENDNPTVWVAGNVVSGKTYIYSHTETTVTDEYWGKLKAAEAQGMLEFIFPSSELGETLAQQQIEMVTSSTTKQEYEEKLCAFSASLGQGNSYKFENGMVTQTINGQPQTAMNYVEFDNVIYVANGKPLCYIDTENNCIYEMNETETNTTWHYYEMTSES